MSLLRKKTIEQSIADTDEPEYQLKKRLTALDLTVFGIGVIIGAGIFTLTGRAAQAYAGPSIALSFVLAAICCGLAALCYAEFSSTVPVSGSAYTFSYFSLGEIFAWIIGWDLLLELMLGASVVAQGWSTYAALFLEEIGLGWPDSIGPDSSVNVLAMLLVIVLTILATIGIKESLRVNLALVAVKLFVVLFVIVAGLFYVQGDNLTPFIPPRVPAESGDVTITTPLFQAMFGFTPSTFGLMGLVSGASLVFFAFIGFDVVATTAEEAKNPQRDLPRGILGSLAICTVLYVLVCIVITGMVNYKDISSEAALAEAFRSVGRPGFATLISAGAVAGLTTVVLTLMIGAARVVFAMSRDHLVPSRLGKTHQKLGTPYRLTLGIGLVVAIVAGLTPIGKLEEMVNIGTLAAFTLVSIAVPLLRKRRPDIERSFTVPGNPVIPILSAVICVYLMLNLSIETWLRFAIWMVLGFIVYAFYGFRKSRVGETERTGESTRA
ncbi:APA family basic amino acid/polyamine antiporter [Kribbella orskensis]|uniref:APA family basic amino acid/polyamine antiporter n=1 Tax=Kribbella orskensis TaxID=2512216 RepID=A0ABY2BAB5_9ACTN|nr:MULTISPECIES: amino acid permease [Kribbella]TCN31033.1 APA family basic amino acid/polyamine antiporter [Kribbella sp. VKM Ac-2500]TCO11568.1 APA family basic amino acid/polyamine antiporter [Kribbella orskensis]